jgi:serine protease inhibitor
MSKILIAILVLCIGIGFMQCTENTTSPTSRELTLAEKQLVESDNKFGFKLFKEINKTEKDKNVFISPLSVSMALGMTYNGADGSTKEAMETTLELSGLTIQEVNESYQSLIDLLAGLDPKVIFEIANSIWYRLDYFLPEEEFINLCETYFDAEVRGLDFNNPDAADTINAWVNENTNGKIEEIVDKPIDPAIVMFLINAIYFKGTWTYEFDEDETKDDWFYLLDGSKKACKMMEQGGEYNYFSNDDFQAIDLPYGDGDFSMTIFLPHPGKNIDSLIAEFDEENWDNWINSFSKDSVNIYIPKFKLEYELELKDVLTALGMGIAFVPYQADFTKMYSGGGVWIDKVKHKTFVEVNEEGTEAAAVTSVEMGFTSVGPSRGFVMRVERPFVFVIRENHSQTILFMGKIVEPTLD